MRIPKSWVPSLARKIVQSLIDKELIEPAVSVSSIIEEAERLLMEELMVEDRLNDEVRQMLKNYETEIERGRLDYRKLFDITKQKLVRERNIVL
ncbi:MAG: DUF507 family protein [Nitrospirales bacterium]|nr:DUF507 family protein [Nitrospirales bacterium]